MGLGKRLTQLLVATLSISALFIGCAGDKGDINLVQPGYIKKSDLLNKSWYYRRTVVDAAETVGPYASIGSGDLFIIQRLRWEFTEDALVAYRDYEYVPGSEEAKDDGSTHEDYGEPIIAIPVSSHFDINRAYSASTGEKTNVIVPNVVDRPWYEREYAKLRWSSTQLSGNPFVLPVDYYDLDGGAGGSFFVDENDSTSPWRARLTPESGYMDFVNNHYVESDPYTCRDMGMDPYSCGAGEIKVRHAFWEVDEKANQHYEKLYYPDSVELHDDNGHEIVDDATGEVERADVFKRFGFFRIDRLVYDHHRGITQSGVDHMLIRFDIWEKSLNDDGTRIDPVQRTPKPIVYYLNWDFPEYLRDTVTDIENEWNKVFKETVASAQGKNITDVPQMFYIKDNNCLFSTVEKYSTDNPEVATKAQADIQAKAGKDAQLDMENLVNYCAALEYHSMGTAEPFTWQQIGDPRINMLYWIDNRVPATWSGYGPMLADPTNGRNVVSSSYILGWTIESAATRAAEYVEYINDEITMAELLQGVTLPEGQTGRNLDQVDPSSIESIVERAANRRPSPELFEHIRKRSELIKESGLPALTKLDNSRHFQERLNRVGGTHLEREYIIRDEDLMMASRGEWRPGQHVSDELYDRASPIKRAEFERHIRPEAERFFSERTFCPMAALDDSLVGLAKVLKGKTFSEKQKELTKMIFKAVALHEIGHNVGLRHNYEGSYDALNFNQEFWNLSSKSKDDQLDARRDEYRYSSIMDYHGKINADFQGLGLYDKAAAKFGYGQIVETFIDPSKGGDDLRQFRMEHDYNRLATPKGATPAYFSSVSDIANRKDIVWDWTKEKLKKTEYSQQLRNEVPYMFCSDEFQGATPTCKAFDFGANQREIQEARRVKYKNYYLFTNYLRNRLNMNFGVMNRGYGVFRDIVMTYHYLYLYKQQPERFNWTSNGGVFDEGHELYEDMLASVEDGLNMMNEVMGIPEPDEYYLCAKCESGYKVLNLVDGNDNGSLVTDPRKCVLNPDVSKREHLYIPYTSTEFDDNGLSNYDCSSDLEAPTGYQTELSLKTQPGVHPLFLGFTEDYVDWQFSYVGTYWDKQYALMELMDPFARFFRIDQTVDYTAYSIGLNRWFPGIVDQVANMMVRNRHSIGNTIAPFASAQATEDGSESTFVLEQQLSPVFGSSSAQTTPVVLPPLVTNLQRTALLYGMAFLTSPLDQTLDFSKHARVWLKGAEDEVNSAGADTIECKVHAAGKTFVALRTGGTDDKPLVQDASFKLVKSCGVLVSQLAQLETVVADLNSNTPVMGENRGLTDEKRTTKKTQLENQKENLEYEIKRVEQFLEYNRLIHRVYEEGSVL
ncbi:MAG: zinc-dependent metalloprotease [Myxococcota bacterium]|nr:zinc-dependent metalloprotease [Myxococcota bacterium]